MAGEARTMFSFGAWRFGTSNGVVRRHQNMLTSGAGVLNVAAGHVHAAGGVFLSTTHGIIPATTYESLPRRRPYRCLGMCCTRVGSGGTVLRTLFEIGLTRLAPL